jgi:hypothetical protein
MPLILAPYTLGTQLVGAPAAPAGGAGYVLRKRRFLAYITSSLLIFLL